MNKPLRAYKNARFLMSDDARPVRLLSEYLEPLTRFQRLQVYRAVIFFGSARLQPNPASGPDYYALASDLAERMARWTVERHAPADRYYLCSGSGPGIMEATGRGVARVDRRLNIGLNISLPFEQDMNEFVDPELAFEFHYFFMRKFWFMKLAEAMVVFPGGYGTFDELFEMLTLVQTGKAKPMPFVLFGREFWQDTVNFQGLVRRGLISSEDLERIYFSDSVDSAFDYLVRQLEAPRSASRIDPA
ncbi:MAG: LOG family protein [Nevskiales bacterium]|nr:LOG family protein [Nevskiales bacterium]